MRGTQSHIASMLLLVLGLDLFGWLPAALANPTGGNVVAGQATIAGQGTAHVTITQASQRAIINWQQFNIAPNEVTQFIQPNVQAIALNRIFDQNPSQIFGSLRANGTVMLLNQNGIVFGPNAQVNVGGLIASSLNLSNANFLAGHYLFQGSGIEGPVKNMGAIHGAYDGVYLLAPNVENSGIITSPQGNIVLAAGATAYLSGRPDGRGFLAELSNPLGQAVNVKDLIADGGNITMAGRVVNQAGLIRADSIQEQNGKIELLASQAVTLQDGSRTLARGGTDGVSNGGTVRAIADLTNGTATFEKGALIDVSGGKNGGNGGFAEVSGAAVRLGGQFRGLALPGFTGGRFLIDPTVVGSSVGPREFAGFEGSGASSVTFQSPAGSDLTVTGQYDLNAGWNLSGTPGMLTFLAGKNLIFDNATLTNKGSSTRWDYVGTAATGDVLFKNSVVESGFGGSMTFTAAAGNIRLVDSFGNLSILKTTAAGGNITLTAGIDVVSPSKQAKDIGPIGSNRFGGIRLDGPGNLTITAGNDWKGDVTDGVLTGPGFVLTNGTATVTAGRNIGGPTRGTSLTATDADEYANLTLGKGTINLTAQTGSIYLGRVQDKGAVDTFSPSKTTVDPSNSVVLNADQDIHLNPRPLDIPATPAGLVSKTYPASFSATTNKGSIYIEKDVTLWPSPTGTLKLSAGKDLIGVQGTTLNRDENWDYIFIGYPNVPGGYWKAVNLIDAAKDPALAPFLGSYKNQSINNIDKPDVNLLPKRTDTTTTPIVRILEADPNLFNNQLIGQSGRFLSTKYNGVATGVGPVNVQDVLIEARSGDIRTLQFSLNSTGLRTGPAPFPKRVTMRAANDIVGVNAAIGVPGGVVATVQAGRNMNMRATSSSVSGDLTFNGTGTARVIVGGTLDLADSTGINFRLVPNTSVTTPNQGGFLDIAVGQDLKMESSRISTYNGAPISIHGLGSNPILDSSGNVRLDNGKPVVVTGNQVIDANGRKVIEVNGKILEFNGKPVVLDNATVLSNQPVTISLSLAEQGGALIVQRVTDSTGAAQLFPYQVLRAEIPLNVSKTVTGFDPIMVNGNLVLVAPDGSVLLAPASQVVKVQALPGSVAVGSNVPSNRTLIGAPFGITTSKGGGIDVFAAGDINVQTSRISTFYGGDINLTSTTGSVNAGSGSRNQSVDIPIPQGNDPVTNLPLPPLYVRVPSSGISTFHPADGVPLKFLQFNDPEINALKAQAEREKFFGRQASADALLAKANALQAERQAIWSETVLKPYISSLKLGDVNLVAERGSIVIPSAGIQGRTVQIFAPTIDNQGGQIIGNVIIPPTVNVSGPPLSITGTGTGAVATPITPVSGSTATASVSATTAAVSTSSKATEDVQEAASEGSAKQSEATAKQVAAKKDDDKKKKGLASQSIRMKRGVVIQVDVKPQVQ